MGSSQYSILREGEGVRGKAFFIMRVLISVNTIQKKKKNTIQVLRTYEQIKRSNDGTDPKIKNGCLEIKVSRGIEKSISSTDSIAYNCTSFFFFFFKPAVLMSGA